MAVNSLGVLPVISSILSKYAWNDIEPDNHAQPTLSTARLENSACLGPGSAGVHWPSAPRVRNDRLSQELTPNVARKSKSSAWSIR